MQKVNHKRLIEGFYDREWGVVYLGARDPSNKLNWMIFTKERINFLSISLFEGDLQGQITRFNMEHSLRTFKCEAYAGAKIPVEVIRREVKRNQTHNPDRIETLVDTNNLQVILAPFEPQDDDWFFNLYGSKLGLRLIQKQH